MLNIIVPVILVILFNEIGALIFTVANIYLNTQFFMRRGKDVKFNAHKKMATIVMLMLLITVRKIAFEINPGQYYNSFTTDYYYTTSMSHATFIIILLNGVISFDIGVKYTAKILENCNVFRSGKGENLQEDMFE